jgi:16S rRNA (guanine1207-N2)-methyltransferase
MTNHYFSEKQESEFSPFFIPIKVRGQDFKIYSAGGIFSVKELDNGSEILIKYADLTALKADSKVLDLGCGYGVVGLTLLKENPDLNMTFSDVNERALKVTRMSLKIYNLRGLTTKSDVFSNLPENYDLVLTNPPYAAGRVVCFSFITQSFEHLNVGGSLQLVCRRRKGGDVLEAKMKEIFGNVEVIGQGGGFRLYKSVKV